MFAFDIDEILKKANVTSEDVKKIVNNFKTLENEISSVVHDLNLFTQSVEVSTQGDKVAEQLTSKSPVHFDFFSPGIAYTTGLSHNHLTWLLLLDGIIDYAKRVVLFNHM